MRVRERSLMHGLFGEAGQTERSAIRHPRVEARRLGACGPAQALLAVASHAERAAPAFRALAAARGASRASVGEVAGELFSKGRVAFADFFLTTEQSYRGTLLGMRHGVDVITLFRLAALAEGDLEVVAWADAWLEERLLLLARVTDELRWFAEHPDRALASAKGSR